LSFVGGEIQRIANAAASQVDTIQAFREFFGETNSHTRVRGKRRAREKRRSVPLASINLGSGGHIVGSQPLECGGNYLLNKWLAIVGITIAANSRKSVGRA